MAFSSFQSKFLYELIENFRLYSTGEIYIITIFFPVISISGPGENARVRGEIAAFFAMDGSENFIIPAG